MRNRRWQDGVMLVLGLWLIASPLALQYADFTGPAAVNSYVFGGGLVLFSALALARPQTWEEWVNLALGIWLVIAPFALHFQTQSLATWNHIILGLLAIADAIWAMPETTGKMRPSA